MLHHQMLLCVFRRRGHIGWHRGWGGPAYCRLSCITNMSCHTNNPYISLFCLPPLEPTWTRRKTKTNTHAAAIHMPSQLSQDKYPSILVLSSSKVNSQTDIINLWKGDEWKSSPLGHGSSSSLHWKIPSPQPSFAINVCGDRGDRGHHGGCHRRKPQGISIPHTLYNTTVSWSHRWRILWKAR